MAGYATVTVSQATGSISYTKLYRQNPLTLNYAFVAKLGVNFVYVDNAAPLNIAFQYRVDNINSSGTVITSTYITCAPVISDYWYLATSSVLQQIDVSDVKAERSRQSEDFAVLGSKYKEVQTGLYLGESGTVEFVVANTAQQSVTRTVRSLIDTDVQVFLKSPFGQVMEVTLLSPNVTYMGLGHVQFSLPYVQVAEA